MSSSKDSADPLRLEPKLQRPVRQSVFEKQKAEAEAKRRREAAETAAVYEDFIKSFDHDDNDDANQSATAQRNQRPGFGAFGGPPPPGPGGASRRHFGTSSALKSGPGSLGMPPVPFAKKRSFNDFSKEPEGRATLKFDDKSDDDEMVDRAEEKAIARPTLRLSNLPPGISPATIKSLLPSNLTVEDVKIQPPAGPGGLERKCTVAIVTLSKETPATDMDAAVSSLQNKYMGYGYYLSLHRHLSSAVSSTLSGLASSTSTSQPFGAKPVDQQSSAAHNDHSRHGFQRGFAPPTSYSHGQGAVNRTNLLCVPVKPPRDIRMIRLINKVIEGVLEHGPEFEALLMSRASVQREERWAWLWDARSQGGVWYRWMLWGVITGSHLKQKKGRYVPLFDGGHAWKTPETGLRFEYTTKLDEFVSDEEYDSSEDEDFDGDANRDGGPTADEEKTFLNPLEKAKLVHLLSRLPTTMGKVRKGDIARVTAFAITHVSRGADEVVDLIISNVERPFSLAVTDLEKKKKEGKGEHQTSGADEGAAASENTDASGATLVGLYVVSDILSASSTSSVRHAWRYRQLLETALRSRKVFERLGMMAEKLGWGRLRAEKWKRSVTLVLNLWEGWCVFPVESHALFVSAFEHPPSLKSQEKADESAKKGKWKIVEANQSAATVSEAAPTDDDAAAAAGDGDAVGKSAQEEEVVGEPVEEEEVVGEPIEEDDVDGEPIEDEDVDGEPIDDDDDDVVGEPMDEDDEDAVEVDKPNEVVQLSTEGAKAADASRALETDGQVEPSSTGRSQPRRRMRAADMFADSDHSDDN
ncbi:hypothetical protein CCMA1212_000672 [Trichoderma ghanense]|uniref:CID domain-containing protein n=1 Tax=Trichoderma ghanense TaxID=65468 RepID=A0ABY2HG03_9HYPO